MSTQTSAASTRLEQQQQISSSSNFSCIGSDYCPAPQVAARVRPQLGNAARKVTKIAAASDDNEVQNNAKLDDDLRTGNDDNNDVDSKPESGNVERRLQPDAVDQRQNIENLDQNQQSQSVLPNQQQRRYNRISMIIFYGREALCVLALILTTYASIQNR